MGSKPDQGEDSSFGLTTSFSRRQMLRLMVSTSAGAAAAALLAACGGSSAPKLNSTSTAAPTAGSSSAGTAAATVAPAATSAATSATPATSGAASATTSSSASAGSGGQTAAANFKKGGTLIVGNEADMNDLDPVKATGTHANRTLRNVMETLVSLFNDAGELQPDLATKWEISGDGLTYTFHLRDAKFHTGDPVTADDVNFTFARQLDPNNEWYKKMGPFPYGNTEFPYLLADKTESPDPKTVIFHLSQPDSTFLDNLTWAGNGIIPAALVKQVLNDFSQHPVGAGPFKFTSYEKGTSFILERFDDYWAGPAYLDKIIFKPVVEDASRLVQLQAGQLDLVPALPPDLAAKAKADSNLGLIQKLGNHIWWVTLNTHEKPFQDKRVRQAMNYAIDKQAIVKSVLAGLAEISPTFGYPGSPYFDSNIQPYPYDPDKAKSLLADAGYADGFSTVFLVPQSGSGMIAPTQIATVMQSQLAQVGVKAQIQVLEWTSYLSSYFAGLDKPQAGMGQMSWMVPSSNPGMYVNELLIGNGGLDAGYYDNPDVNKLLLQARATTDENQRADIYKQAAKIVADDAPWIFMFYAYNLVASNKKVQNIVLNPDYNNLHLERVWIK
jgi:peptide/nickel transport system substrate-binding protein